MSALAACAQATYLLGAMLEAGFAPGEAAFGFVVDPEAVSQAATAGVSLRHADPCQIDRYSIPVSVRMPVVLAGGGDIARD